ncbi:superoxide dismutase [Olivibacter domesticus]|uniref:Superoxide dismutase n=1 Tax=Olivibacter domesticus TaxID=407022 RepID=A0A1H7QN67_OLID1|nr:superoxide dismutase [Olivibacter domesticus]SEL48717.1 superoxide dismutase, Fe-Mn family [Olivibacter domesticus]
MKITRRKFIYNTAALTTASMVEMGLNHLALAKEKDWSTADTIFNQVKLPYDYRALEPYIDALTMQIHYEKHHAAYVKAIHEAMIAEDIAYATEREVLANISKFSIKARNNAGGAWNHNFFWESMTPKKEDLPIRLLSVLNGSFDTFDNFKKLFIRAATDRFGSGWVWLVEDKGKVKISATPNQDNPLMDVVEIKGNPLLGLDVWEHAYYLKYQNRRSEYIHHWWNLINWPKVDERLG